MPHPSIMKVATKSWVAKTATMGLVPFGALVVVELRQTLERNVHLQPPMSNCDGNILNPTVSFLARSKSGALVEIPKTSVTVCLCGVGEKSSSSNNKSDGPKRVQVAMASAHRLAQLENDLGLKPCGKGQNCFSSTPSTVEIEDDTHYLPPWSPPAQQGASPTAIAEAGIAQIKSVIERYPPGQVWIVVSTRLTGCWHFVCPFLRVLGSVAACNFPVPTIVDHGIFGPSCIE